MQTVVIVISLIVLIWIGVAASFQGLDLRKWSSWLYGVWGFLSGLALSTAISGDLIGSLKIGAIFAFMILFTGATMRRHKQKYGGMAKDLGNRSRGTQTDSKKTLRIRERYPNKPVAYLAHATH